jgi:transmembrane sensor
LRLKLSSPETAATDQAATWFARQRGARPWSEADATEFAAWLKADPAHTMAWTEYERLWGRLETVRDNPKVLAIREQARWKANRQARLRNRWRVGAALAASVLIGVGAWRVLKDSEILAFRPPSLAQTSAVNTAAPALIRDASTEIGERSLLVLADGSKVTLNTTSAVRADYSGRERRVTLVKGEAFFDVAKDPARPFIVAAGSRQVIAVGTAFDVRLQDRQLQVTLVEGKVRVITTSVPATDTNVPAQPVSVVNLEAGSALVALDDGGERIEKLDTGRATSWRTGKLIFEGERLADVVTEMNRYSREQLVIADSSLEGRKVSGVFEPTNGAAFAKALEAYGIARATRQSATTIVLDSP